ncbi:MAG: hypothetical protein KDC57_18805 [Saprospiraceae bacterium]|nr:hypothetical protein [Saprospiraceae bacterium]
MRYLLITLLVTLGWTCSKDQPNFMKGDFFIYGVYHGYCAGECVTLFKLTSTNLYMDDLARLDPDNLKFQETPLPDSSYQKALVLWEDFPEAMWEEPERLGMPDAHDQGGYFIRIKEGNKERDWYIDTVLERLPDYVQEYIGKAQSITLP